MDANNDGLCGLLQSNPHSSYLTGGAPGPNGTAAPAGQNVPLQNILQDSPPVPLQQDNMISPGNDFLPIFSSSDMISTNNPRPPPTPSGGPPHRGGYKGGYKSGKSGHKRGFNKNIFHNDHHKGMMGPPDHHYGPGGGGGPSSMGKLGGGGPPPFGMFSTKHVNAELRFSGNGAELVVDHRECSIVWGGATSTRHLSTSHGRASYTTIEDDIASWGDRGRVSAT